MMIWNIDKKQVKAELEAYKYHGILLETVTLEFPYESITLEKNIEYVILIVKKDR
jgi:hypothetical protein